MSDKEALQEVVYIVNDYVNGNTGYYKANEFIEDLTEFLEQNVIEELSQELNYIEYED